METPGRPLSGQYRLPYSASNAFQSTIRASLKSSYLGFRTISRLYAIMGGICVFSFATRFIGTPENRELS